MLSPESIIMNNAYLLIGGNLGDRLQNLATARELINQHCGKIVKTSSLYETAAWGETEQPSFLNQALIVETDLNAMQLLRRVLKTEKKMGRVREKKFGPRIIDSDILLFNNEQYNYPFLKLPHPEMHLRRFALEPMAEIAPDALHNVSGKNMKQLLEECQDRLPVKKLEQNFPQSLQDNG
jgi:2-amino-4-hydroxy-6-hydroxymethyldihydropteridine diphosphokinase